MDMTAEDRQDAEDKLPRATAAQTVGAKFLRNTELPLLDSVVRETGTTRSVVLREAFLWAIKDEGFLAKVERIQIGKNGRAR